MINFFAVTPPLSLEQGQILTRVFTAVIDACEPLQNPKPYKQITLVRLTYVYARSEASRDNFLRFFFQQTKISSDSSPSGSIPASEYAPRLIAFAQTLFENFFLPCKTILIRVDSRHPLTMCQSIKAATRKTPQPSPATVSDIQSAQSLAGTTQRLATLRRDCLIRDRYRCVISRTFDRDEAMRRVSRDGDYNAQDDEGNLLSEESGTFAPLEVAHIIPHPLMTFPSGKTELVCPPPFPKDESKQLALAILNMFDDGVVHLIESNDIDHPRNAITLTHDFHQLFGGFEVYFEPTGNEPHIYRVDSTSTGILRHRIFPVNRTLFLTDTRTIDPPSPRLLAIHSAIVHILHMSAAGRYIDSVLEDLD